MSIKKKQTKVFLQEVRFNNLYSKENVPEKLNNGGKIAYFLQGLGKNLWNVCSLHCVFQGPLFLWFLFSVTSL